MAADREWDVQGELAEDCKSIILHNSGPLKRLLNGLVGSTLRVRFVIFRAKRSDAQNRYIHGVAVPCVRAWHKETQGVDLTHDEAYGWLRTGVLKQKMIIKEVLGTQIITFDGKRFSAMNTKEFSEAVNFIADELAKVDCIIPMPRENNFITDHIPITDE
jgi:hypothetical protein